MRQISGRMHEEFRARAKLVEIQTRYLALFSSRSEQAADAAKGIKFLRDEQEEMAAPVRRVVLPPGVRDPGPPQALPFGNYGHFESDDLPDASERAKEFEGWDEIVAEKNDYEKISAVLASMGPR